MKRHAAAAMAVICAFVCSSCDDSAGGSTGLDGAGSPGADSGGGAQDSGVGAQDSGGGAGDAGTGDAGAPADAGGPPVDGGGPPDANQQDAGETPDAGGEDAGQPSDAGGSDAGQPFDAGGVPDAGVVDPFLLEAQHAAGLAVDGSLADWPATGCADLGPADYHQLTRPLNGASDLSARVCVAWSQTHLYLSARVTDEAHRNQETAGSLWAGDSLQVAIDADLDRTPGAYDSDGDYEYGFAMLPGGPARFRFHAPAGSGDGAQIAIVRGGQVSTYEAAIPFADLAHLDGATGERFGLSFLVNDDDLDGREGWIEWTRGVGEGKDPSAFGAAVLVGGAGADAGVVTDAGGPHDAGGAPDGGSSFNSRYGINTHLPSGNDIARMYDKVAAAGIDWVRVDFDWVAAEPKQDQFNWGPFDAVINAAHDRGLHVFATLAYSPAWANGGQDRSHPATNSADWYDFCFKAAQRYDGKHGQPAVAHWGMWNEPDHENFFTGTAADYISKILIPCSTAVRAANPAVKVLAPDLAHKKEFLTEVLKDGKNHIDIVTVHNYSKTVQDVMDYFDGTHWPWEDKNIKEILQEAGVLGSKPVWFTEAGWPTDPAWTCWFGTRVSEAEQANLYVGLLDALVSRTWIQKIFFYEMIDANIPDACQWGILRNDFGEKQAYGAYRDYITAHPPAP